MRYLIIILILLTVSCRKQENEFDVYKIYQGNHFCNGWKIVPCDPDLEFSYSFGSDCMYDESKVISGWNKLYGFTNTSLVDWNHEYSCRLGWQWNSTLGKMIVSYYCYIEGVRHDGPIDTVSVLSVNYGRVQLHAGYYLMQSNEHKKYITVAEESWFTYFKGFPYFGGQSVAPHDMTVYIKDL